MMFARATSPPIGVIDACIPLTAPHEAAVVEVPKIEVDVVPKRTSLHSMLPPDCMIDAVWSVPASKGLPDDSAQYIDVSPTTKSTSIAAQTAQPCRCEPVILPSV